MQDLDTISTLSVVVLQTIALHDVHEANLLSGWNLTGKLKLLGRLEQPAHLTPRNISTDGPSIETHTSIT
jgi:hypothetical protein